MKPGSVVCDRQSLIMYNSGVYISFSNGVGDVCDEIAAEAAEKALEDGKRVYLTANGKVVSYVEVDEDGNWTEHKIKGDDE